MAVKGRPLAHFLPRTPISGDSTQVTEQANLYGIAGAVLTVKIIELVNNNPTGQLKVNGSVAFINNTFTFSLDGTGRNNFLAQITGNALAHGTTVRAKFSIESSVPGVVATNSSKYYQISKAF